LQTHLGDHRLLGHPGRAADLDVEGVEREQHRARRGRRGHGGEKAVGIAAFDDFGAGLQTHAAPKIPEFWGRDRISGNSVMPPPRRAAISRRSPRAARRRRHRRYWR
jgi:hypothetical protein